MGVALMKFCGNVQFGFLNMRRLKVAYIGGSWSSNIGNAYYNLGTEALLKSIEGLEVFFIPDPPQWKAPTENDFDLIGHLKVDYVILTGPCLNLKLEKIFRRTFDLLKKRGVKIGFLSAGMSLYDEGEARKVSEFLNKYEVSFIFSRDHETYNFFKEEMKSTFVYDGICNSMFLDEAVAVPEIDIGEYYVFNFDHTNEPVIGIGEDGSVQVSKIKRRLFKRAQIQCEINGIPIIRTNNNSIGIGYDNIYRVNDTYHSDLPYGYLSILKHARTVFSERVHTCAATLNLGGKAQFIPVEKRSFEKRSNLFDRLNLRDIQSHPVQLDFKLIEIEKNNLRENLKRCLK